LKAGRSRRECGDFQAAREHNERTLRVNPVYATANYEVALVLYKLREYENAKDHLDKALEMWNDAAPDYKPALEARATLAQWQQKEK
jgi:tetratricopeptide (TPR) repeat protein